MSLFVSDYLQKPANIDQRIPIQRLANRNAHTLQRGLVEAGLMSILTEHHFSFRLLSELPYDALVEASNNGPVKAKDLIDDLIRLFEQSDSGYTTNLADKVKMPRYSQYLIPWSSLSGKSRNILQKGMAISNVSKFDVKTGFSYDQLQKVEIDVFKNVSYAGKNGVEGLILELVRIFNDLPESSLGDEAKFKITVPESIHQQRHNEINDNGQPDNLSFSVCRTIDDLYLKLEEIIENLPQFQHLPFHEADELAIQVLKARHPAFCQDPKTLSELGKLWGVTRERIRQIEIKFKDLKIPIKSDVPILDELVELMLKSESESDFIRLVRSHSLASDINLTALASRLKAIIQIFERHDLSREITLAMNNWKDNNENIDQLSLFLKNNRSKFGLFQLATLISKTNLEESKLRQMLIFKYPRTFFAGDLVLARTANHDSMFEGTIGKQLKVSSILTPDELLIGLKRFSKYRQAPLLGSDDELSALITKLFGSPATYESALTQLIEPIKFEALDRFLIDTLIDTQLGVLHRNEVLEKAIEQRISIASVGIYLLYSPIIRSPAPAIFKLVGTNVDQESVNLYSKIYANKTIPSRVDTTILNAFEVTMTVIPNLNIIANGSVFLPPESRSIFEGQQFRTSCSCGKLETEQVVKFTDSGFWNGFAAMFSHGVYEHQLSHKGAFNFKFDFKNRLVFLVI